MSLSTQHGLVGVQAGAVRILRTQSAPADDVADAAAAANKVAGKQQFAGFSEPSSPMIPAGELPDSIRNISTSAPRSSSEAYRYPSFQTGFKPW